MDNPVHIYEISAKDEMAQNSVTWTYPWLKKFIRLYTQYKKLTQLSQ